MSKPAPFIAIAGGAGKLGQLIATALRTRNIAVKALVRPHTDPSRTATLRSAGVTITEADLSDIPALTSHLTGATAVVSALQGLRPVILGAQKNLLEGAVAANVPRFIPSDFSLDFTKCAPGSNRNCDLRREFHAVLDESGIASWTSVLNGAFMDMLAGQMPLINDRFQRVLYCNSPDQALDFTTWADTAAFTAAVAADEGPTPRYLRVAGQTVTPAELAAIASRVRGVAYAPFWVGSAGFLEGAAGWMRSFGIGGREEDTMTVWQAMQYMGNMFSGDGKLEPLDNGRYPELKYTQIEEVLARGAP